MNSLIIWASNTFDDALLQEHLEEKLTLLLEGPLREKSDYAKEKAIKVFCEGLGYLEKLLQKNNKISKQDFNSLDCLVHMDVNDYKEKIKNIQSQMLVEINRQYRHFLTFL